MQGVYEGIEPFDVAFAAYCCGNFCFGKSCVLYNLLLNVVNGWWVKDTTRYSYVYIAAFLCTGYAAQKKYQWCFSRVVLAT